MVTETRLVKTARVNVTHDWGKLKEVVIGRVTDFRFPEDDKKLREAVAFAPADTKANLRNWAGKLFSEAMGEGYVRCIEQVDNFARFLVKRGVIVHRSRELNDDEKRVYDQFSPFAATIFTRDPMVIIGNHVIETSLRMPHRFKERFGLRPLFEHLAAERDCHYVVMPPPAPTQLRDIQSMDGPFLEGGDVFPFGRDILVGYSYGNFATDIKGIRWLEGYLGAQYRVHPVRVGKEFLHMDVGMATLREGLAILCPDVFPDGLPDLIKGWEFITVTPHEAEDLLGANGIVLGPNEIIVDSRMPQLAEQLSKRGVTVHTIDYDAVSIFAGGMRCSHHPIIRELD